MIRSSITIADITYEYDSIIKCPRCGMSCRPDIVSYGMYGGIKNYYCFENSETYTDYVVITYACPGCNDFFFSSYSAYDVKEGYINKLHYIKTEPIQYHKRNFSKEISELSPRYCEIYNQAAESEAYYLDEICGMGYRKALEILIKDYIVKFKNTDSKKIGEMSLQKCINDYINDEQLKTLATGAVWIGNDFTHYIKKWENRDIEDLKKCLTLIELLVIKDVTVADINTDIKEVYENKPSIAKQFENADTAQTAAYGESTHTKK